MIRSQNVYEDIHRNHLDLFFLLGFHCETCISTYVVWNWDSAICVALLFQLYKARWHSQTLEYSEILANRLLLRH